MKPLWKTCACGKAIRPQAIRCGVCALNHKQSAMADSYRKKKRKGTREGLAASLRALGVGVRA